MTFKHSQEADKIHVAVGIDETYADNATRDADTAFKTDPLNINKFVRVDSPLDLFWLKASGDFESLTSAAFDTLAEVLANGNVTGGTDLIISSGDDLLVIDHMTVGSAVAPSTDVSIDLTAVDAALRHNRLTTVQRDALTPLSGMAVYNTDTDDIEFYNGVFWQSMGGGDVVGPAGAVPGALAFFNGVTGKLIDDGAGLVRSDGSQLFLLDNTPLVLGSGNDFSMLHNNVDTLITNHTGQLSIVNEDGDIVLNPTGAVKLADNIPLDFGAGDFVIVHDGFDTTFTQNSGDITWKMGSGNKIEFDLGSTTEASVLTVRDSDLDDLFQVHGDGRVGIGGTPNLSTNLQLQSASKGFRTSSMTDAERDNIASPVAGLQIHNLSDDELDVFLNSKWNTQSVHPTTADNIHSESLFDTIKFADGSLQDTGSTPDGVGFHPDTISISLQSFSVTNEDTAPLAIFVRADGLKLYMTGNVSQDIFEYDMTIPWDLSTLSFLATKLLFIGAPRGVFFKPDGTKVYVARFTAQVHEFTMSTPWDVTSITGQTGFLEASGGVQAMTFKADGTSLYLLDGNNNLVKQYDMSTPWDVDTASEPATSTFDYSNELTGGGALTFRSDGRSMYVGSGTVLFEYELSTPWDITTANPIDSGTIVNGGFIFSPDGTKAIGLDRGADSVHEFDVGLATSQIRTDTITTLSGVLIIDGGLNVDSDNIHEIFPTTFETGHISTAEFDEQEESTELPAPLLALEISFDQTKYFTCGNDPSILQYDMVRPGVLAGATFVSNTFNAGFSITVLCIDPDGINFITVQGLGIVRFWTNPTAYDFDNAVQGIDITPAEHTVNWVAGFCSASGQYVYLHDQDGSIFQYIRKGWGDQSLTYTGNSYSTGSGVTLQCSTMSGDGKILYVNKGGADLDEIILPTPWQLVNAQTPITTSFFISTVIRAIRMAPDASRLYAGATEINNGDVSTYTFGIETPNLVTDGMLSTDNLILRPDVDTAIAYELADSSGGLRALFSYDDVTDSVTLASLTSVKVEAIAGDLTLESLLFDVDIKGSNILLNHAGGVVKLGAASLDFGDGDFVISHDGFDTTFAQNTGDLTWVLGGPNGFEIDLGSTDSDSTFTIDDSASANLFRVLGDGRTAIGEGSIEFSAAFSIISTTRGFLPPRMTEAQRDAIAGTDGLIIHNLDRERPEFHGDTDWQRFSVVAPQSIEIFTAADLDALASGGVITIISQTAIILKANITTSNRFDVQNAGRFTLANAGQGYSLTYSGSATFITAVDSIIVIEAGLTASGGGTLFDVSGQIGNIINVDFVLLTGWKMGTIRRSPNAAAGPAVFFLHMSALNWQDTLTLDNVSDLGVDEVALIPFAGAGVPFLEIKGDTPGSYSINLVSGDLAAGESLVRIDPGIANASRITVSGATLGGTLFDTSGIGGVFDSVTDASVASTGIDSVSDSPSSPGVARFNFTVGPTLFENQEVVNIGFTTNTDYNETGLITATGAEFYEIASIAFGSDEASGSFTSDSVTMLETLTALVDGDTLVFNTLNSTEYDGGATVYNQLANSFQVNRIFNGTADGEWSTAGIDQTDPRVLANNNPGFADSNYIATAFVNDNSTANGAIVNNTFTDMVFGPGPGGLNAGSTIERWKLIDPVNGTFEYTGNEPFAGYITFDFTVVSSGGSQDFRFEWLHDVGAGFVSLPDAVEALVNVGSDAQSITKTFPLKALKGDQIEPQITRNAGTSGITTTFATMYATQ